jgi:hypothetical protein
LRRRIGSNFQHKRDVVEIRQDLESRIFTINMRFPPNAKTRGQIAYLDACAKY